MTRQTPTSRPAWLVRWLRRLGCGRFPVLVSPAPLADDLAYSAKAGQPLVSLISRSQAGRAGQPPYYPYLAFRLARPLLVSHPAESVPEYVSSKQLLGLGA